MAEEPGANQETDTESEHDEKSTAEDMIVCLPNQEKTGEQHKNNSRRYDDSDGWIVVRSQKRPGLYYDFHVKTGESHWRDQAAKKVPDNGAKSSKEIPFCGFEPTEPQDDPPAHHETSNAAPKIYNKQIINNQFPFGNAPYTQNNNTAWATPSAMIYPWTVTPFHHAQTVFGPLPIPAQNTFAPLSSTVPTLNQAQTTGFGSPNVPVPNISGPFNTTTLNQAQTVVGPLPNLPGQKTLASVNSTMPHSSQAQAGFGSMQNVPVENLSERFNTTPLNQAQTVIGPLPNLPLQNTLAPANSTMPHLSQAQAGFGSMPNVPVDNLSGPFNPPLNQAQTVVGPLTNFPGQKTLASVNSTMPHLSQAQAGFKPLPNVPIKNSSVPLSNRFQVLSQFNRKNPANSVKSRLGFKSAASFPPRNQQNYMRRTNNPNDLRSLLSGRNRQEVNEEVKKEYPAKTQTKEDIPASLDEDEINPDDTDEWLEEHTDDEGKKLTVDMDCIWKLADSTASRESWYIVPTAIVLLNNIRFFTSLVISDERARLLAPLSVIRALRSATFADNARVADCAKRAMILIRQSSKHPDTPKNLPNVSSCLELIDQNKLVVLLFDEKDKERREIINDIPKFSIDELKQYFTKNSIAAIQKIENITIVVPNKEDKTQSIPSDRTLSQRIEQSLVSNKVPETHCIRDNLTLSQRIEPSLAPNKIAETQSILRDNRRIEPSPLPNKIAETQSILRDNRRIEPSPLPNKEAETQTRDDITPSPMTSEKRTVNASVQTDFQFTLVSAEKGHEEQSDKSVTKLDLEVNAGEACHKDMDKKTPSKKIRLKRQHQPLNISDNHEIKTFKWRKRKETSTPNSTLSQVDSCHKSYSSPSTSTGDLQHLVTLQDDKAAELEVGDVSVDVQLNDNVVEPAFCHFGVDEQLNRDIVEPAPSDVGVDVQLNDNVVEPAFSDVGVNTKTVDETSTSNSIDCYSLFQTKQAILNELEDLSKDSNAQKEIEYKVTSEFMEEHLSSRCDEWVSRFTQIMEEVLTQVLHMDPPYIDKSLPPPWNVQEATACIKRKLKSHTIIVNASDRFDSFLHKISDDRGNIRTDIRPQDFMKMYSYGVNLVNVLQMVLKHEDLQIASEYLSQLLSDIREPNLDLSQEFETLCDAGSPNISESITNMSITEAPASNTAPAVIESPQREEKRSSCNNSPARYSLRSSQRSSRAHSKQTVDNRIEVVCDEKNNEGYSLFSTLGLQKNNFKPDTSNVKTITNVPQNQTHQTSPTIQTDSVPDNIQEHKGVNVAEPKITRNINIFNQPNIDNKLSDMNNVITEVDYVLREEYMSEDYGLAQDVDFTQDETIEYEPEGKNTALKLSVHIATYPVHKCIMDSRQFCEDTHNNLKSVEIWDPNYKADVMEKTTKLSARLQNVCNCLKRILDRDPSVTKRKFGIVTTELGTPGDMNDTQLADYRRTIEKYLQLASYLQTFVTFLNAAVKKS